MDETVVSNGETTSNDTGSTTAKNETNNNKNNTTNSTTNKTSTTRPSQQITQPSGGHVHNWTEVKTQVAVQETGHYETIYGQKTVCNACQTDISELTRDERDEHFKKEPCRYGTYTVHRVETGQQWIVDTPATTEERVTGYKCSCGATREKTQYAGMYSKYDKASWDSVVVSNGSTDGAWMWIFIRDWKLDDYSYLQDGVKEGIIPGLYVTIEETRGGFSLMFWAE